MPSPSFIFSENVPQIEMRSDNALDLFSQKLSCGILHIQIYEGDVFMAEQEPKKCQQLKQGVKAHIYFVLYILLLIALSTYVILNWGNCISMQFFSQFNGNNILFLVWIMLIVLPFYDIEGKEVKLKMRSTKSAEKKLQEADLKFQVKNMSLETEDLKKVNGGDSE